jgi:hypothetical protein
MRGWKLWDAVGVGFKVMGAASVFLSFSGWLTNPVAKTGETVVNVASNPKAVVQSGKRLKTGIEMATKALRFVGK